MIKGFYFFVFILSLVLMISILIKNKNVNSELLLFCLLVSVNCLGLYLSSVSQTLEMAFYANNFMYLGGCFIPFVTVLILARLCKMRVPAVLKAVMLTISGIVLVLVFTCNKYPFYYKNIALAQEDGFYYLEKEYGPLHILYPILMITYLIIMVAYLFYAVKKKRQISSATVTLITVMGGIIITIYFVEMILDSKIEYLAVGYLMVIVVLNKYYERVNMYDMSTNIESTLERMKDYGYIVLDKKFRYINANDNAKEIFPEINEWIVDKVIPESEGYLYRKIIRNLIVDQKGDISKDIKVNDRYFNLFIRDITYGRRKVGYLLEFIDRTAEKKYYQTIQEYNAELEKEVTKKTADIMHVKDMMVLGMADMVESRDNNTGGHIKRTSAVVRIFAKQLKKCNYDLSDEFLKKVEKAAPMHDLGKIAIDDKVLRKPGKYTEEEYNEMKRHSEEGARIVENILRGVEEDEFVVIAKNIAHYHHEKWNGKGYPCGLSRTDIPIEARIMALADVFDALVSKRCYKEAFTYDEAFDIIKESLGEHFDPELGEIFILCRSQLEELYDTYQ